MIKGEAKTGFEKAEDKGSFNCGNCHYMRDGGCDQEDMKKHSKEPRIEGGRVKVGPKDCCEFVDRMGRYPSMKDAGERAR